MSNKDALLSRYFNINKEAAVIPDLDIEDEVPQPTAMSAIDNNTEASEKEEDKQPINVEVNVEKPKEEPKETTGPIQEVQINIKLAHIIPEAFLRGYTLPFYDSMDKKAGAADANPALTNEQTKGYTQVPSNIVTTRDEAIARGKAEEAKVNEMAAYYAERNGQELVDLTPEQQMQYMRYAEDAIGRGENLEAMKTRDLAEDKQMETGRTIAENAGANMSEGSPDQYYDQAGQLLTEGKDVPQEYASMEALGNAIGAGRVPDSVKEVTVAGMPVTRDAGGGWVGGPGGNQLEQEDIANNTRRFEDALARGAETRLVNGEEWIEDNGEFVSKDGKSMNTEEFGNAVIDSPEHLNEQRAQHVQDYKDAAGNPDIPRKGDYIQAANGVWVNAEGDRRSPEEVDSIVAREGSDNKNMEWGFDSMEEALSKAPPNAVGVTIQGKSYTRDAKGGFSPSPWNDEPDRIDGGSYAKNPDPSKSGTVTVYDSNTGADVTAQAMPGSPDAQRYAFKSMEDFQKAVDTGKLADNVRNVTIAGIPHSQNNQGLWPREANGQLAAPTPPPTGASGGAEGSAVAGKVTPAEAGATAGRGELPVFQTNMPEESAGGKAKTKPTPKVYGEEDFGAQFAAEDKAKADKIAAQKAKDEARRKRTEARQKKPAPAPAQPAPQDTGGYNYAAELKAGTEALAGMTPEQANAFVWASQGNLSGNIRDQLSPEHLNLARRINRNKLLNKDNRALHKKFTGNWGTDKTGKYTNMAINTYDWDKGGKMVAYKAPEPRPVVPGAAPAGQTMVAKKTAPAKKTPVKQPPASKKTLDTSGISAKNTIKPKIKTPGIPTKSNTAVG